MKEETELKALVREKYGQIALQEKEVNQQSCCGAGACSTEVYNIMSDDYQDLNGYAPEADLGLGCGLPTQFAQIKAGDVVLDLGSGAGNDCFVARHETGPEGKVIGIDFTPAMIEKARKNAEIRGFDNVYFVEGDIESIPLQAHSVDVVVSNCVLNLVPNKAAVFAEIYRVLKPGGHFSISDVVLHGTLPQGLQQDAEMYAGCVAGAIPRDQYLGLIFSAGFEGLSIQKQKPIDLPEDILSHYLNEDEIKEMKSGQSGIFSITVYAKKPSQKTCAPGSNCC